MATEIVNIQTQITKELAELGKTVAPPSGHRISLKGKIFTFPDGTTSPGPITAVILDWRNVNTYYRSAYNPQQLEAPTCFAIAKIRDELKPSEHCDDPQHENCETCPLNAWGTAPGGRRGKACKNLIRIAVVPPDAIHETPPWTIDISPSATGGFTNFVNSLKGQLGMLPLQVAVKLNFDQTADYPKVVISEPEPLTPEVASLMFELRNTVEPLLEKEPGA